MTIKDLCDAYQMTPAEIAKHFEIPLRTVQNWYSGRHTPPKYVLKMMLQILSNCYSGDLTYFLQDVKLTPCGNVSEIKIGDKLVCLRCGAPILVDESTFKLDVFAEYIHCPTCGHFCDVQFYHDLGRKI